MKTATLFSSCGQLEFDTDTGRVARCALSRDFGPKPVRVDVEEWHKRYPGEDIVAAGGGHDILDFGLWFRDGHYDGPCEGWRTDREEMLREEADESDRETVMKELGL